MQLKWMKKRFTFLIIPDANNNIMRFRIHGVVLYLISTLLLVLVIVSLILYIFQQNSVIQTHSLTNKLSSQSKQYNLTVTSKDQTIEKLQTELVQLSEQANAIKAKINQVTQLENEMKKLTGEKTVPDTIAHTSTNVTSGGEGGVEIPVGNEDIVNLIDKTRTNYINLDKEITNLIGSLTNSKQKVIQIKEILRITPSIWPTITRTITSPFGVRIDPFTRRVSMHSGLDISGQIGDPVYVTADGVVTSTGRDSAHGNNIIVSHSNGISTWYMHLSKILVDEGQTVTKGLQIGRLGNTGRSTGPHLHYELINKGVSVNPMPYLKTSREE